MYSLPAQLTEVLRLRALLLMMTSREILARVKGTALGVVWLYAQPLMTVAAYYLVFDVVFKARLGEGAPTHSLGGYLVVGMVPWMAFADSVSRAMASLVEAGSLLQKNALTPVLFPARMVAASASTYLPLIVLLALIAAAVNGFSAALLCLPLLFGAQLLLAFLLGYALAILAAAMRDVLQLASFLLSLGVFASPVLFTVSMIPEELRWLIWLNPMSPAILAYQTVLLTGQVPALEIWLALAAWLAALALFLNRLIGRSGEHLVDWL
jgi:lipopolysaccharide transport system permease protein